MPVVYAALCNLEHVITSQSAGLPEAAGGLAVSENSVVVFTCRMLCLNIALHWLLTFFVALEQQNLGL